MLLQLHSRLCFDCLQEATSLHINQLYQHFAVLYFAVVLTPVFRCIVFRGILFRCIVFRGIVINCISRYCISGLRKRTSTKIRVRFLGFF
jgi:hypothetical protein